jgi:ATP-dependent DNA helicase MPH1
VFVAPTKPLVAQQIEACHRVCGIPGSHAVELTGNNPRAMRSRSVCLSSSAFCFVIELQFQWIEKRVFYMTPQTLMNDLLTENCDSRDIILLVIGINLVFSEPPCPHC